MGLSPSDSCLPDPLRHHAKNGQGPQAEAGTTDVMDLTALGVPGEQQS